MSSFLNLSQQARRRLLTSIRSYSTTSSPHPALTLLPAFLTPSEQSLLLSASLKLLSSPAQTNSSSRKQLRTFLKSHPSLSPTSLLPDEAYAFQPRHFDGVIDHYREILVRPTHFPSDSPALASILSRFYALIPPPPTDSPLPTTVDPPPHVLLHLLHLASNGAIYPHVDNREASGGIIVGLSLGSQRVMRFAPVEGEVGEPFEVLLEPGSAYIQRDELRTGWTHEVRGKAVWEGKEVGGEQRVSLMLRDKLPDKPPTEQKLF